MGENCCGAFTIETQSSKMNSGCVSELPVKAALGLAFSLCLIFFGIQVRDEVVRYFRKLTTITQTIQTPIEGALHLPSISICVMPAFKTDLMESMGIDQYAWSYIVGYSNGSQFEHEAVDNASNFELITYRMDEVFLHNIDAVFDLDVRRPLTRVKVKPLYTVFNGKCYVIEILDKLKAYEVMIVDLGYVWSNKSPDNKFLIYIHDRDEEFHLKSQFWLTKDPEPLMVTPGSALDLTVTKSIHKHLPFARENEMYACRDYTHSEYMGCYYDHIEQEVQYKCYHPILLTRGGKTINGMKNCTNTTEIKAGVGQYVKAIRTLKKACRKPCTSYHYKGSLRESFVPVSRDVTSLFIMYSDIQVMVNEEIFLFDITAIISAVGGTLGLFIGFSVFDTMKWIIKKCFHKYRAEKTNEIETLT